MGWEYCLCRQGGFVWPVSRPDDEEDEMSTKKTSRDGFKPGEHIVYPAHGVGQVTAIEEQEIAGFKLELFVVSFAKEKMTLRVPVAKATSVGMRKLSDEAGITKALEILTGRARVKRTMWSRRAQEYEAKINSGDIIAVSEVVRDLYRSEAQPEQSYSERQLFETALARLVDEVAAVDGTTDTEALKRVEASLAKGPRRPRGADAANDADDAGEEAA
jgi:CarD family transcriptional regulator